MKALFTLYLRKASLLLLLSFGAVFGQLSPKKMLSREDYAFWSSLWVQQLSDGGQWVSYTKHYDLKSDTLFVKSTSGATTYAFHRGVQGKFNGDSWFACLRGDTLQLQHLKSGRIELTTNVSGYAFAGHGKYLLLDYKSADASHWLVVKTMSGELVADCSNVLQWKINESANLLTYSSMRNSTVTVDLLHLNGKFQKQSVVKAHGNAFDNLTFKGDFLAFIKADSLSQKVYRYNLVHSKLDVFESSQWPGFPKDIRIGGDAGSMQLSEDGAGVFFHLKETVVHRIPTSGVQIWQASDRQLYPNIQLCGVLSDYDKVAVWWPDKGRFFQVTDKSYPNGTLSGDGRHAFVWDPLAYEPQSDFESPRDVYIVDLLTGRRKLLLKQHSGHIQTMLQSPDGKYVSYPSGGHWWVYDIAKETHTNVTAKLGVPFYNIDFDRSGEIPQYGNPGWSSDGASILLYDQYDVWQVAADGTWGKRLTRGRESGITYRLQPTTSAQEVVADDNEAVVGRFDLKKPLLMATQDLVQALSGFSMWDKDKGVRSLVWEPERITRFIKAKQSGAFIYIAERFDTSPHLMLVADASAQPKQVLATNEQQRQYYWGKSERISYQLQGKTVSGALFWPADYQVGRQYPMIVHIYERQLGYLHEYVNPTLYNEGGFNITNLTAQGYFVLLPDIVYRFGEVGASAMACVLAAVDAVVAKGCIDEKKIGLEGHSFGGYETDYIITQTNRFATAVSGSAFTDVVSSYLYIGGHYAKPDYWRFEHFQQRLGKSLFEDPQLYLRNSPVIHADKVQTPLLAWTGVEDRHVNYYQSIEFYLALRRLHKKHTLLIYPGEGHALMEAENQIDFTHKMEQWFGYYLKGEAAPSWMQEVP